MSGKGNFSASTFHLVGVAFLGWNFRIPLKLKLETLGCWKRYVTGLKFFKRRIK